MPFIGVIFDFDCITNYLIERYQTMFWYNLLMYRVFLMFAFFHISLYAKLNVVVSILPQQTFLKAIGKEKVESTLMVRPGNSPHTYEPKASQMRALSTADLYLAIGVEFEKVWLPKFQDLNNKMPIVDITKDIQKIAIKQKHHSHKSHTLNDRHRHGDYDPHVWISPENVKILARNIYKALIKLDKKNKAYYLRNLKTFLAHVTQTDATIKKILSSLKSRTFMVFHPSWSYFAHAYRLRQIAVEIEGKTPKPKELVTLIKVAKEKKITAIFTQPEFSDTAVQILAKELQIPVIKVSPLASNWSENLMKIAKTIAGEE